LSTQTEAAYNPERAHAPFCSKETLTQHLMVRTNQCMTAWSIWAGRD
jgi:hypothetical protein